MQKRITILLILLFTGTLFSQIQDHISLERELLSLDSRLDSSLTQKVKISSQAEIITRRLSIYQGREDLNSREHRTLRRLLQQAQELELKQNRCDSQIASIVSQMDSTLRLLSEAYETLIQNRVDLMENERIKGDENIQEQLAQAIEKKRIIDSRLNPVFARTSIRMITMNAWDTPDKLRLKGDLLSDQEESLRQELAMIDQRLNSLGRERNLRSRLAEMEMEVDLFSQREEVMENQIAPTSLNNMAYWDNRENEILTDPAAAGKTESYDLAESSGLEMDNPSLRTPATILKSMDALMEYRKSIASRADSLAVQARGFYQNADDKEK